MTRADEVTLRARLEDNYQEFRKRLWGRLGSSDLAEEVLHETWLKLGGVDATSVVKPDAYILRVALNIAAEFRRKQRHRLSEEEINYLIETETAAFAPSPESEAGARDEMRALERALLELPDRRRMIFVMARIEQMPQKDIARRLGISVRMVQKELCAALRHCREQMEKNR